MMGASCCSRMANLIIPFPEGTRTVALRGVRITIGRLPDNTIQLRDRTVSAHHAELIMEDGHYRIHDLNSSNGVLVDGRTVKDFHLRENCAIQLGEVLCQFQAGAPEPESDAEVLPGRGEVNALRQENRDLKGTLASLQKQIATITQAHPESEAAALDHLARERAALEKTIREQQAEMNRLKENLAVMTRDRDNLQRAYEESHQPAPKAQPVPIPVPTAAVRPPKALPPVAVPVAAATGSGLRLPKPPGPLGIPSTLTPSTPARRPPSAVTLPPVRVIGTPPVAGDTGPKGTQKLAE